MFNTRAMVTGEIFAFAATTRDFEYLDILQYAMLS